MIKITDISGVVKYLNSDLIERIELIPDTLIILVNGSKYIVRDPPEEIINRISDFRKGIACKMEQNISIVAAKPSESEVKPHGVASGDSFK